MERIKIDNKLHLEKYTYEDLEEFKSECYKAKNPNYNAILEIWNPGIIVYLIFERKKFIFLSNVGFISMVDCFKLPERDKDIARYWGIPNNFFGIFINDMIVAECMRNKGIGSKVISTLLLSDKKYLLEPIKDGKFFWKKFGFEYNKFGKLAYLESKKREN